MDENFIPYEQIKPLLKPGMTGKELAAAILRRAGLPADPKRYTVLGAPGWGPMIEKIRDGVEIVTAEEAARRVTRPAMDEVVA